MPKRFLVLTGQTDNYFLARAFYGSWFRSRELIKMLRCRKGYGEPVPKFKALLARLLQIGGTLSHICSRNEMLHLG